MNDFIVRSATPEDAEDILEHIEAIAAEPDNGVTMSPGEAPSLEEERKILAEYATLDNAIFIVAESSGGKIIGVTTFRAGRPSCGWIGHYRKPGVAQSRRWHCDDAVSDRLGAKHRDYQANGTRSLYAERTRLSCLSEARIQGRGA
jgi:hypothetical protein